LRLRFIRRGTLDLGRTSSPADPGKSAICVPALFAPATRSSHPAAADTAETGEDLKVRQLSDVTRTTFRTALAV
jgi:hypothetical protein